MEIAEGTELGRNVFFRVGLIRISDQKTFLYTGFSHLLLDGASGAVILSELLGKAPAASDRKIWEKRLFRLYRTDHPARA